MACVASGSQKNVRKRRSVGFEAADIVEFEPTLYTASITSGGVPVGMSSVERRRTRRRLDSFELERHGERVCRQEYMEKGYLAPEERETILGDAGLAENSMCAVTDEVHQVIEDRRESNEMDVEYMYGLGETATFLDFDEPDPEGHFDGDAEPSPSYIESKKNTCSISSTDCKNMDFITSASSCCTDKTVQNSDESQKSTESKS